MFIHRDISLLDIVLTPQSERFVYSLLSLVMAITIHVVVKKCIQSRDTHSVAITSVRTIRETHENITLAHSWLSLNS